MAATLEEPRKERTPRLDWAGLLRRAFALDVFTCVRCGGRHRVLARQHIPDVPVVAIIHLENVPSLRVAERLGMRHDRIIDYEGVASAVYLAA